MQLGLAHHAAQAEQKPVVVIGRIVDAVGVTDEDLEQRAQLQQLVPILVRPRQPADLASEDDAGTPQGDFRQQALEAGTVIDGLAADALIVVDDQDTGVGPAEADRSLPQLVLQVGRLTMVGDLMRSGLADIDDSETIQVASTDLGRRQIGVRHASPPLAAA